jgi:hypothetical protein
MLTLHGFRTPDNDRSKLIAAKKDEIEREMQWEVVR